MVTKVELVDAWGADMVEKAERFVEMQRATLPPKDAPDYEAKARILDKALSELIMSMHDMKDAETGRIATLPQPRRAN